MLSDANRLWLGVRRQSRFWGGQPEKKKLVDFGEVHAIRILQAGNHAGTVSGLMNCIGQLGAFCVGIVFGRIVDATQNFNAPLFLISVLMCIGSLLWLWVDPTRKLVLEDKNMQVEGVVLW